MSVHALSWAWKQTVGDAGAKLVLLKLADQANDRGECWPSQTRLADECEMSRRTVQRKLEILYAAALVVAQPRTRENGSDTSLLYRVGSPVRQSDAPPCVTGDAPPTTPVTHHEPSLEPTSPSEDGEGAAVAPRERDEIWDFLEEQFGSVGTDRRAQAHQKRNKACADLKRLDATVDDLRHAVLAWSRQFVGATLTDIALATHFPQLRPQRVEEAPRAPEPIDEAAAARARLDRAGGEIPRRLKQGVCPECGVGGGNHIADCAQARELPRQAYTRFVEETVGFPLSEVEVVIASWSDLDDVERQHFRDLAEEIRNTSQEEAA